MIAPRPVKDVKNGLILSKRNERIGSRQNHSAVFSEHFKPVDFSGLPGVNFKPGLKKDELGVLHL